MGVGHDDVGVVEDSRVIVGLPGQALERIASAFEFVAGQGSVDDGDVDADLSADAELVKDPGVVRVVPVLAGQASVKGLAQVGVVHTGTLPAVFSS